MLYHIFDISNIALGGMLLLQYKGDEMKVHPIIKQVFDFLEGFRNIWGYLAFGLGVYFLIFRSGCAVHDIAGILVGLMTLRSEGLLGHISFLDSISEKLEPYAYPIGIAALIVGTLGLLNIHILC